MDDDEIQETPADDANAPDTDFSDDDLDSDDVETDDVDEDDEQSLPSLTYRLENGRIQSMVDEQDAMLQAVKKILMTDRFVYPIYDEQYGNDINELIGKDEEYVDDDIERVITEALESDDRITNIEFISKEVTAKDTLSIVVNLTTIFGDFTIETEVNTQ